MPTSPSTARVPVADPTATDTAPSLSPTDLPAAAPSAAAPPEQTSVPPSVATPIAAAPQIISDASPDTFAPPTTAPPAPDAVALPIVPSIPSSAVPLPSDLPDTPSDALLSRRTDDTAAHLTHLHSRFKALQSASTRRIGPAMAFFTPFFTRSPTLSFVRCTICIPDPISPSAAASIRQELSGEGEEGKAAKICRIRGFVARSRETAAGGTSALFNHAQRSHPLLLRALRSLLEKQPVQRAPSLPAGRAVKRDEQGRPFRHKRRLSLPPVKSDPSPSPTTEQSQDGSEHHRAKRRRVEHVPHFEHDVAIAICKSLIPPEMLQNWAMVRILKSAPPSKEQLTCDILPQLRAEVTTTVRSLISSASAVSLTLDVWRETPSVLALNAHFIDSEWTWRHANLGIIRSFNELPGLLDEFHLSDRVFAIVHASHNLTDDTIFETPCMLSCIARAGARICGMQPADDLTLHGERDATVQSTAAIVARVVRHLDDRECRAEFARLAAVTDPHTPLPVPWVKGCSMSLLQTWERMTGFVEPLNQFLEMEESRREILFDEHWLIIHGVTRALGRFREAMDVAGWETMSDAVMRIVNLALSVCNRLESLEASGVVQTTREELNEYLKELQVRQDDGEGNTDAVHVLEAYLLHGVLSDLWPELHPLVTYIPEKANLLMALALDPRFCSLGCLVSLRKCLVSRRRLGTQPETDEATRSQVLEVLNCYDRDIIIPRMAAARTQGVEPPVVDCDPPETGLFAETFSPGADWKMRQMLAGQLGKFRTFKKSIQRGAGREECLAWWRFHEDLFPDVASLFRKVVGTPGGHIKAERIFGVEGIQVRRDRERVVPAADLVFLHENATKAVVADMRGVSGEEEDVEEEEEVTVEREDRLREMCPELFVA